MGTSCFWLTETVIKIFSSENTTSPTDLLHSTNDYVKSSTRIPHLFFVFWKNAGNLQFLFLLWRIFKENLGTNADFSFHFDVALIMAAMCNSFFLLTETLKFVSSDTTSLNDLELVTNDVPYSPNGKRNIHDPFKENIDSSQTVAMIQRGPWSWTNSIIFITIADPSRTKSKCIL